MSPILFAAIFDDPAKQWLAIGAGIFLLAYFVLRPLARRKEDPLGSAGTGPSISRQRSVEREMSNLLVELSEMARQVTAQLDTRSTKLELLMKEADEKIQTLRALNEAGTAPATREDSSPLRSASAEREALLKSLPNPTDSPPTDVDPRHAEIYALADAGRSTVDIASRLGRPSGEIELILALRQ